MITGWSEQYKSANERTQFLVKGNPYLHTKLLADYTGKTYDTGHHASIYSM